MAEIGKATVKIVPDASAFGEALEAQIGRQQTVGIEFFWLVAGLLLLACSPAIVALAYKAAF